MMDTPSEKTYEIARALTPEQREMFFTLGAETTETHRNIDLRRLQVRALRIEKAQALRDLGVDVEEPEE